MPKSLQWTAIATLLSAAFALATFRQTESRADETVDMGAGAEATLPEADVATAMHAKLEHSQTVLHGLVTQDFAMIAQGAADLRATSLTSQRVQFGDALDDEVYEHFRLEFLRLSTKLGEMARSENLEGSAHTYNLLTGNCMACHQYLQDKSPARLTREAQRGRAIR